MSNVGIIADLKRMGWTDAQIAGATVNGKPLYVIKQQPKSRYKSKAEALFAERLQCRKDSGEIQWWDYEPMTLVIVEADGKRCRYTPDFATYDSESGLCFYEVKGFLREAARLRFLAAKERYPFVKWYMVRYTQGKWEFIL